MMEIRVPAGKFKTECLQWMDRINRERVTVVITKRGRPVARLVAYEASPPDIHGFMHGSVRFLADVVEPLDVTWEATID